MNRILSSIFFYAIPILYQMLDSVDAQCWFRLIVKSLIDTNIIFIPDFFFFCDWECSF